MFVAKLELCLLALIDSGDHLGHCHVHDEQLSIYLASGQCIQAKCMGEGVALRNRAAGEDGGGRGAGIRYLWRGWRGMGQMMGNVSSTSQH